MKKPTFAGVDPGVYGSLCVIDEKGKMVATMDPPLLTDSHQQDPASRFNVGAWVESMHNKSIQIDYVIIERPTHFGYGGKSGWWTVSLLTFSYAVWVALCMEQIKGGLSTVDPREWKKHMMPQLWIDRYIEKENKKLGRLLGVKHKKAQLAKLVAIGRALELCKDPKLRKLIVNSRTFEQRHGRAEAFLLAVYCKKLWQTGLFADE